MVTVKRFGPLEGRKALYEDKPFAIYYLLPNEPNLPIDILYVKQLSAGFIKAHVNKCYYYKK